MANSLTGGEDYLYPAEDLRIEDFVPIELPKAAEKMFGAKAMGKAYAKIELEG